MYKIYADLLTSGVPDDEFKRTKEKMEIDRLSVTLSNADVNRAWKIWHDKQRREYERQVLKERS